MDVLSEFAGAGDLEVHLCLAVACDGAKFGGKLLLILRPVSVERSFLGGRFPFTQVIIHLVPDLLTTQNICAFLSRG